eukprot:jgi/Astpho2/9539/Aster-x0858
MTSSIRKLNSRSDAYSKRIHKRGEETEEKKTKTSLAVGPIMVGFFLFVVVGSALLQIIRTATSGGSF